MMIAVIYSALLWGNSKMSIVFRVFFCLLCFLGAVCAVCAVLCVFSDFNISLEMNAHFFVTTHSFCCAVYELCNNNKNEKQKV